MPQLFEQLLPFSWRGVQFPVRHTKLSVRQDIASHKYWGVDGANQEGTGREALHFTATIPFLNTIVPGKRESWGVLYPTTFRQVLSAMAERSTGQLVHPELGTIRCKPVSFDVDWSGDHTGGVEAEATWIEHRDPDQQTNPFGEASPVTVAELAALDLDAQLASPDLLAQVPQLPKYETDFSDLLRSVAAVGDQVSLLSHRAAGKIDAIAYRVDAISDSIDRAKSAMTWPAKQAAERLAASMNNLRQQLLQSRKDIVTYVVLTDQTLSQVVQSIPDNEVSLSDVIRLNPQLVREPVVKRGTVVRYYVPRVI